MIMMNNSAQVKIKKLVEDAVLPFRGSEFAAGYDVCAVEDVIVPVGETVFVGTGLAAAIPVDKVLLLYPRSGLASKKGLRLANCVGVIDSDYRGEIKAAIYNDSGSVQKIEKGERIAQLVLAPYFSMDIKEVSELPDSTRGENGFGSTGTK